MDYCRKIVVLSQADGGGAGRMARGVLSLEQTGKNLSCKFKTFNIDPKSNLVVAIKIGNELLSPVNVLKEKAQNFEFSLNNSLKINDEISVLVCEQDGGIVPLLYGGRDNDRFKIEKLAAEIDGFGKLTVEPKQKIENSEQVKELKEQKIINNDMAFTKTVPENEKPKMNNENLVNETENEEFKVTDGFDEKKKMEKLETKHEQKDRQEQALKISETYSFRGGGIGKQVLEETAAATAQFYDSDEEVETLIDSEMKKQFAEDEKNEPAHFFVLVEEQVEQMFKTYPAEPRLAELIDNSRWARVDYDGEGLYYSLGLIYDDGGKVKYICYAVPAKYGQEAPEDIREFCQFLPFNANNERSDGYYIMYQDAETGENISMEY